MAFGYITAFGILFYSAFSFTAEEYSKHINIDPDPLNIDLTPSVYKLTLLGEGAIPYIVPHLESDDLWERKRGQRVLEGVTSTKYGFVIGKGWPSIDAEQKWRDAYKAIGNFDASSSKSIRQASVEKLKLYLKK